MFVPVTFIYILLPAFSFGDKSSLFFDGETTKMELNSPMVLTIYEVISSPKPSFGPVVASIPLKIPPTSVSGTSVQTTPGIYTNTLHIDFSQSKIEGINGTLTDLSLSLELEIGKSYWTLRFFKSSYTGNLSEGKIFSGKDVPVIVAPSTGYTENKADEAFGRFYKTGASKILSWTCHNQVFKGNLSDSKPGDFGISFLFPGLILQPFISKNIKFGYEWNCDPLLSVGIWMSLFLTLIFIVILYWSIYMLYNLQTPERFDDPKGTPLSIPVM